MSYNDCFFRERGSMPVLFPIFQKQYQGPFIIALCLILLTIFKIGHDIY